MTARTGAPWIVYALGALLAGAIAAAVLVVGPASGQQATQTRTVEAQRGVVQSTVSGSGNIQAASELDLGFKTSGTVTQIDATQGERVGAGQLLATLDPQSAEVTLQQARAGLQAARAKLADEEETDGESSSAQSAGGSAGASSAADASAASAGIAAASKSTPATPRTAASKKPSSSSTATSGAGSSASTDSGSDASTGPTISAATREANIASARAAVRSDELTVGGDEQAVADTRLVAPHSGTIVSLSGEVGETVSGGGTSRAARTSEGSSSSATGGATSSASGASTGSSPSASGSSASSGASSSPFAVLSDLSSLKLVVPLSESEVGSVRAGQTATVTVEALKGTKLAAHVSEVAALSTSNSGVVSYDVTFTLDQLAAGLKPGMSASAEVVVAQAEGVNVPTSAISAGAVTVVRAGKQQRQAVTTGLAGDSSTLILSGLNAGEEVVLPLTAASSATSLLSRLGSRTGTGTLGGAGLGGGFAGGGFARGGAGAGRGAGAGPGG